MEIRNGGVYGGSPLDRLNNERADEFFVRDAFASADARFLLVDRRSSRVHVRMDGADAALVWLSVDEVPAVAGIIDAPDLARVDAAVDGGIVLLGAAPRELSGTRTRTATAMPAKNSTRHGPARFAVQVAVEAGHTDATATAAEAAAPSAGVFVPLRSVNSLLSAGEAAIAAHAVSLLKFHERHAFCGMCGAPTVPEQGGGRRRCSRGRGAGEGAELEGTSSSSSSPSRPCTAGAWFPRIDPVAIMLVVDSTGERCLLGRAARFPAGMWSCLAGFMEHGERVEDAVRREVFEEAGVGVCVGGGAAPPGSPPLHSPSSSSPAALLALPLALPPAPPAAVRFFGSQPWPEPYSLMLGCVAQAARGAERITRDPRELADARWFAVHEVAAMVARSRALFAAGGGSTTAAATEATGAGAGAAEPFVPPMTSIAGQMLAAFAARDPITVFPASKL